MKICDVVLNSIWYDPRVRKQISEYISKGCYVHCVGYKCNRYDVEKVKKIPCNTTIVDIGEKLQKKLRTVFMKLKREKIKRNAIVKAIIETKPDVIHANDLDALIPAYIASKRLKCGLIYDSHEINVENVYLKKFKLYSRYMKAIEKYIVKRVDLMVCVSHAAAEYFAKEYGIEKPLVVTNCSLKSEQAFSFKKDGFEVLNHGQFYSGRGYDVMIEACKYLREYPEIKIALRGFGRMEDELKEAAEKLENKEQVVFYPPVLVNELIPEASKSQVGVAITEPICLNFKLSVSNKLFEYASAGLPVIMSDIPEHRYLNDKYHFGIVIEDNSPKAFAEAVIKLYTDNELYASCAEGAKRLSDEVNWENEFGKLIEFERRIVNG